MVKQRRSKQIVLERLEQRTLYSVAFNTSPDDTSAIDTGTISLAALFAARYNQLMATPTPTPTPAPTPIPTPTPAATQALAPSVGLGWRFGDELVVTPATQGESISFTQVGNQLDMTGNGQTTVAAIPAAGFFIYTPLGSATISLTASITAPVTVISIGESPDTIISADSAASIWIDTTDAFIGSGVVHRIAAFYQPWTADPTSPNYVPLELNISPWLAEPTDSGPMYHPGGSLWGTGPVASDVNQRSISDCYFLATLESQAISNPSQLKQMAVDLGDDTYIVEFDRGGVPTYVRVDGNFSTQQAAVGPSGDIWVQIIEKAYAYFRTGANTYASLNIGNTAAAAADLGISTFSDYPAGQSDSYVYSLINAEAAAGKIMMANTANSPNLIPSHSYSVVGVYTDAAGTMWVTLENPWGSASPNDGVVTITLDTFRANISWMDYQR